MWLAIFLTLFISSATAAPSFTKVDILTPGGAPITSPNGCYSISLDNSCNILLKQGNQMYWSSGTLYSGIRPCNNAQMQDDGNFVLYSKGNGIATWATKTNNNNKATLRLQDDGNLVIYNTNSQPIWSSETLLNPQSKLPCPGLPGPTLLPNQEIAAVESLYSPNKAYRLVLQKDNNLVVYNVLTNQPLWSSGTVNSGGNHVVFTNGVVKLVDPSGNAKFTTFSDKKGAKLIMQDDGNLVLYSSTGSVVWAYTNKPIRNPIWPFKKMIGQFILLSDDNTPHNTNTNWSPQLYPYQQTGFNVFFFTFINVTTMQVPLAFQNLAKTRGTNAQGAIPANTVIIFSLGGGAEEIWSRLQTQQAAIDMATTVANWYYTYNVDGIDIDHEYPQKGDSSQAANLVTFIQKVKQIAPNMIITLPVFGDTSNDLAMNYVVNQNDWGNDGARGSLIDSVGVMVYGLEVFNYVKSYTTSDARITRRVPNNAMVVGASGLIRSSDMDTMISKVFENNYFGIMVWLGSVKDPSSSSQLAYGNDASFPNQNTAAYSSAQLQSLNRCY